MNLKLEMGNVTPDAVTVGTHISTLSDLTHAHYIGHTH